MIDADLDGVYEYLISTIDMMDGDYSGAIYEYDADDGNLYYLGEPTSTQFVSGSDYVLFEVPLGYLGYPSALVAYAFTFENNGSDYDVAPDSMSGTEDLAIMPLYYAAWLLLLDVDLDEVVGDGDDYVEPGETHAASFDVANIGLADSLQTEGTLGCDDPDVTVAAGTIDAGPIPAGTTLTTGPLWAFEIDPGAPPSTVLDFDISLDAGGIGTDGRFYVNTGLFPGDTCADAPDVPASTVLVGNTAYSSNDYDNPSLCTSYVAEGPDVVYAIDLTAGQTLVADLEYAAGGPDAVLYISTNAYNPDTWCLDGADMNVDETETLTYTAASSAVHYLVVDGYDSGIGGEYELAVTF